MTEIEYEALLKAVKRIERKLDIVIRAIYEHDEDIQDEYGRSQRSIDAGHKQEEALGSREVLGSLRDEPASTKSTNPSRDHGEVQREKPIPRGHSKGKNVPRKDGREKSWRNG